MRPRKIEDNKLISLLKEGKLQKDIAKELGVSEPAITKRLKMLYPERYQVPKVFQNLTEKEKRFVIEKARGKTNTEAALVSYECKSRQTAKVVGSQLMSKPEIQQSLSEILNHVGLTRLYRAEKLKSHVDNIDPYVSLRALDQCWKIDNAHQGEVQEEADIPYEIRLREVILREVETTKKSTEVWEEGDEDE